DVGGAALVSGAAFGGSQPVCVGLDRGGAVGRGTLGGLAAGEVAGLGVGDEPVRSGRGQVRLAVVAGVLDEHADPAGHGGMAGGGIVTGIVFLLVRQGAQPSVAFREQDGGGGVRGVRGRDDR